MKKLITVFLIIIFGLFLLGNKNIVNVNASEIDENNDLISSEIIYHENGDYSIVKVYEDKSLAIATTYTVTGKTKVENYSKSDNLLWTYTLTGYFEVNEGISVTCYNATFSKTIEHSGWSFSNGGASYSGNTAYGVGKFKYKILFVTVQTYNIDITVKCDVNGNIY